MRSYKKEFHAYEMMTDHKATGKIKTKIQHKVRNQLKRKTKQEIEDPDFEKRPTRKDK